MKQVRVSPLARESSPTDPAEWYITEDGYEFGVGDHVYNYYDGEWGVVMTDPALNRGWFDFRPDGTFGMTSLNSVRIASKEPQR